MKKGGVYLLCGVLAAATLAMAMLSLSARPTPAAGHGTPPAQAASSNVIAHAISPGVGFFNSDGNELISLSVSPASNASYALIYEVYDFGGGYNAFGFGTLPSSSFTLSGT